MSTGQKEYPKRTSNTSPRRFQGNGNGRSSSFSSSSILESNGPNGKTKGTASQLLERYMMLSREAQREGESVLSQNFLQYAEHYQRILLENAVAPSFSHQASARPVSTQAPSPSPSKPLPASGSSQDGVAKDSQEKNPEKITAPTPLSPAGPSQLAYKRPPRIFRSANKSKEANLGPSEPKKIVPEVSGEI